MTRVQKCRRVIEIDFWPHIVFLERLKRDMEKISTTCKKKKQYNVRRSYSIRVVSCFARRFRKHFVCWSVSLQFKRVIKPSVFRTQNEITVSTAAINIIITRVWRFLFYLFGKRGVVFIMRVIRETLKKKKCYTCRDINVVQRRRIDVKSLLI